MARALLLALLTTGCVALSAPRLPPELSTALVHEPMRRLDTPHLTVYYPAYRQDEARRFVTRVEGCVGQLLSRTKVANRQSRERMVVVMPEAAFNNAFVAPDALGYEDLSVIPTYNTIDFTTLFGLPPDPGMIGCHELTHFVHFRQVDGFWATLDFLFGDVLSPQVGLDGWFAEGLATYYESRMQPGLGRPAWPVWTGMFHAAIAGRELSGGELSELDRHAVVGNHYLFGSQFIAYLAQRYGEDKLWQVIRSQADAWTIFFFVSWRFDKVYGKSLPELVNEWAAAAATRYPAVPRPVEQQTLRRLGTDARIAWGPDGSLAIISSDLDQPTRLTVLGPDGRERASRSLTDVVPPRHLRQSAPMLVTGLSFSKSGDVWFVALDRGDTTDEARIYRYQPEQDRLRAVGSPIRGQGGSVLPDGQHFVYSRADGDRHDLVVRTLPDAEERPLWRGKPGEYCVGVRVSPDGTRLGLSLFVGGRFVGRVIDLATGSTLRELAGAGPIYDVGFGDRADDVIYLGVPQGDERFQVMRDGVALTQAPYVALSPWVHGGRLRFLNREGWRWTLDETALPAPTELPAPQAPPAIPLPPPREVEITGDRAYSGFDHLFVPQLHSLVTAQPGAGAALWGLGLAGGDRLGFHRWAVAGYIDQQSKAVSGDAGYSTTLLSPVTLGLEGGSYSWDDPLEKDAPADSPRTHRRERHVSLAMSRSWRDADLAFLAQVVDDHRQVEGEAARDRRLGGFALAFATAGVESTPYGGPRRALALDGQAALYPYKLGTLEEDVTDLRAEALVITPLPLLRRQRLRLTLAARRVSATDEVPTPLQVGGASSFAALYEHASEDPVSVGQDPVLLPGKLRFVEVLRGFEDLALYGSEVALGELTWRYPLIIDRGTVPRWVVLPSLYLRELVLEGFCAGAMLDGEGHAACGGALILRVGIWRAPLDLRYQVSRRFTDDEAVAQTVGLGLGL